MERKEWLDSLKEGDKVAINIGGYGGKNYSITEITKITPSRRFEVSYSDKKFNNSGIEIGKKDAWVAKLKLEPITDKVIEQIKRIEILSLISRTNFRELSIEQLLKIKTILKPE